MQINRCYLIHGFLPAFFSACCFAVMAVCIKIASSELPAPQLVFLRSVVGLLIILPIVLPRGVNFIKTPIIHLHMLRGFISLCAMICFFYAISQLGLSESTLLNASSPLFIGLLALPILKEKITSNNVIALIIGFIGICFIIKPGTTLFTLAALIGLCSGLFIACAKILIRYMASTEPVMRTVFYFSIFSTLYSSVLMIWFWQSPTMFDILIIVIAAICATGGQTLLTYSYTHNDAVTVAPFTYVTVIMTTLLGWLGWNEFPDTVSSIGAILIIGSCTSLIIQSKSSNT
jgi:drug/metabolite transporter (DMT)-like permease